MINIFLKRIKHNNDLHKIDFNYVIGDSSRSISKSKNYVFKNFEFYSNELVDNKAFLEQFLLEHLEKEPALIENLNQSIICLETEEKFFLLFLKELNSYTVEYSKEFFSLNEINIIINETKTENFINFIFIYYEMEIFNIFSIFLLNQDIDNLEYEHYEIKNNLIEPNVIKDQSLKFKQNLRDNKSIIFTLFLSFSLIFINSIYLEQPIQKKINKILYYSISKNNTLKKEINTNKGILNKKNNILKKNKLPVINMKQVIDFKKHYKTEVRKLF